MNVDPCCRRRSWQRAALAATPRRHKPRGQRAAGVMAPVGHAPRGPSLRRTDGAAGFCLRIKHPAAARDTGRTAEAGAWAVRPGARPLAPALCCLGHRHPIRWDRPPGLGSRRCPAMPPRTWHVACRIMPPAERRPDDPSPGSMTPCDLDLTGHGRPARPALTRRCMSCPVDRPHPRGGHKAVAGQERQTRRDHPRDPPAGRGRTGSLHGDAYPYGSRVGLW